ncbi:MAG: hypothetical protein ACREBR_01995, partial [bacterium]
LLGIEDAIDHGHGGHYIMRANIKDGIAARVAAIGCRNDNNEGGSLSWVPTCECHPSRNAVRNVTRKELSANYSNSVKNQKLSSASISDGKRIY